MIEKNLRPASLDLQPLADAFGGRVEFDCSLARYTAARIGGPAEAMIQAKTVEELVETVTRLWGLQLPFFVLGGGSNILVSDAGVRGVVVYNRSRAVHFAETAQPPTVWAESGANFGTVARQAAARGLAGLEWAAGIPGTVGGAVVGNAGAHGGDLAGNLLLAEILHCNREGTPPAPGMILRERWSPEQLKLAYRTSVIKQGNRAGRKASSLEGQPQMIVLGALLRLENSMPGTVQSKIDEFVAYRRRTQPPGASMGSMFKNPPGDFAGRLIEAAGLKGTRHGNAEISPLHANFFINHGEASAVDVWELIRLARRAVAEKFGVMLEMEIELVGDWEGEG